MLAQLTGTVRGVEAEHAHAARVARAVPLEDLGRGRLPRSVRPEQAEDLTDRHREAHTTKRLEVAVRLAKVGDLDRIHRRRDTARTSRLLELFAQGFVVGNAWMVSPVNRNCRRAQCQPQPVTRRSAPRRFSAAADP